MSKPQNILGKFDTYAYHHILIVCNSTETAEELAKTTEITTLQHPTKETDFKTSGSARRYSSRTVANVPDGKYVTLIDGLTDARFFINNVNWLNVIAQEPELSRGGTPQSTTMRLDGEMEIVEPLGASFLNRLTDICDELETDPVGLVFLLKTIFVGHNTKGGTEMISNVRPLMFIAYDISAVFDNSGARYKLAFVGLTNGAAKLPQTQKIFEGMSFEMQPTLKDTFQSLENAVNERYKRFKGKAIKEFAETNEEFEGLAPQEALIRSQKYMVDNYRDVRYKIIATDYEDGTKFPAGDVENDRIKTKLKGPISFNPGPDVGLEDIINKIMASSSGVLLDSKGIFNESLGRKRKYIYKIISTVKSSPTEYVVEYHIRRYALAVNPYEQQAKNGEIIPGPGQSIEFNYIFTGKNVDIKTFDLKMEMGMAFFQLAATTNNIPTQENAISGNKSKTGKVQGSRYIAGSNVERRGKSPLFLGTTVKKPLSRNTTRPIDSAGFQALLDRHASLENISASMVIYGNPQLLDELSILPSELINGQTEEPEENATVNPQWLSAPTLVKVNVKMPVNANEVPTEYENFWYTGYYNLMEVENVFADGEFTQKLGMYSIPMLDPTDDKTDEPEKDKEETGVIGKLVEDGKKLIEGVKSFFMEEQSIELTEQAKQSLNLQQKHTFKKKSGRNSRN